ncbi:alpha/beta hydrolase [Paenibacillus marchantiophytorum]|uniref:Alpha/beta hydrolase n=1 Tax=Paenibacillus marchantiophytorum TaxID=1619310 RepID=A0ABQ1EUV6_9BACL|nr:alpha/beta fold hydrolase [Paenibacillus marchantiophytorum]GFZ87117.1 alpha/beta hydrolase [Paenibacillus marchantiophytorum]
MKKWISLALPIMIAAVLTGSVNAEPDREGLPDTVAGSKVDIGGFKMWGQVNGTKNTEPTVVFDPGYGDQYTIWTDTGVASAISKRTQTVLYDRAGLGWSQQSVGATHTALDQAIQLRKLLKGLKVDPPYVFVTHGISALNVRMYAALYQDEVAGVVFLDPSHEYQENALFPDDMDEVKERYKTEMVEEGGYNELLRTYDQITSTSRPLDPLRNIPIYVLSAGQKAFLSDTMKVWNDMQKDIESLSDNTTLIVDKKSGHYLMRDDPKMTINAINNVLDRIKLQQQKTKESN